MILKVNNLYKEYQIGEFNIPWSQIFNKKNNSDILHKRNSIYALNNINFSLQKGEAFGIIGMNGSGKSTLLQIIAGTLKPTKGTVLVNGRISALLELGSGFNSDFTGLENIYLYGSILGISHTEMERKIDKICEFADIGDFINQSVRTYSTGMLMRVAFAVAVSVEPDILIIDEALSVGDILFQQKCNARIRELLALGVTLLVVTHDTSFVTNICKRAMWLEKGCIAYIGPVDQCVREYIATMTARNSAIKYTKNINIAIDETLKFQSMKEIDITKSKRIGESKIYISNLWLCNDVHESTSLFSLGDWCVLIIAVGSNVTSDHLSAGCELRDRHGQVIFATGLSVVKKLIPKINAGQILNVRIRFKLDLAPGQYTIDVGCGAGLGKDNTYQKVVSAVIVEIKNDLENDIVHGIVKLPYEITVTDG